MGICLLHSGHHQIFQLPPPINIVTRVPLSCKEIAEGNRLTCGSMVVDAQPDSLMNRLANQVYNSCRSHALAIPNFPNFDPIVEALKQGNDDSTQQKPFNVCRAVGNSLVVLQSYAQKFLDCDQTQARANEVIENHNKQFNIDGIFVAPERTVCRWVSGGF